MKTVLILMGRYLPGHRDGGPLRTVANVVDALGDEYDFRIACLDRDHGDTVPYFGIKRDAWNSVGKAKVWYVRPGKFTFRLLSALAKDADVVYSSSFYDDYGYKMLLMNRLGLLRGRKVCVAAMGVFSEGALAQRAAKKKVFIDLCKALGLFNGIVWSVTSELEARDLKRTIGESARYIVAEDLPRSNIPGRVPKKHEGVRVAFLSRICAHKGLDVAIDALIAARRDVILTIYGPAQEADYWARCREKLEHSDVVWSYQGDVPSEEVQDRLSGEDMLILPTKSENYGHVIFEALSVGCIPVISDQTPWGEISERGAGFVAASGDTMGFAACVKRICDMGEAERTRMSESAVNFARQKVAQSKENTGYREIFG